MIIDQIQFTGPASYFPDPGVAGQTNLAPSAPVLTRTTALKKGMQQNITGLRILMEGADLQDLFPLQTDNTGAPDPIMRLTVMKEMFSGLFADPFRNRVYNIAGFIDFNEGTFAHCQAMEIDGVPTIVSLGNTKCTWTSKKYELPGEISIGSIAWELATSRLTTPDSFNYSFTISFWDHDDNLSVVLQIGPTGSLPADAIRAIEGLSISGVRFLQVEFTAHIKYDAAINERHLPLLTESLGTPLLRAVNFLEPVDSVHDIYSLTELESLCSDFRLFKDPGPEITRLSATLDLSAVLVHSENQFIRPDNDPDNPAFDINDPASKYEYIEVELLEQGLTRFEVKLLSEISLKPV